MKKGIVTAKFIMIITHLLFVILVIGMAVFANLKIQDTQFLNNKKLSYDLTFAYDSVQFSPYKTELKYKVKENYEITKKEECKIETLHKDKGGMSKLSYHCIKTENKPTFNQEQRRVKIEKG